jgi:hypothetical protein
MSGELVALAARLSHTLKVWPIKRLLGRSLVVKIKRRYCLFPELLDRN